LVVRDRGGYGGFNDRWIDIRVDDHPEPIEELIRVFSVYDVTLLNREDPKDVLSLNANVVREIQAGLSALGFYRGASSGKFDAKTKSANFPVSRVPFCCSSNEAYAPPAV